MEAPKEEQLCSPKKEILAPLSGLKIMGIKTNYPQRCRRMNAPKGF
jgi:hypothetical protein